MKRKLTSIIKICDLLTFYPVGTILDNINFNPNELWPETTWEQLPEDTYLINVTTGASGQVVNKTDLLIKNSNIAKFTQSTNNDGNHSHSYTYMNHQSDDSHGATEENSIATDETQQVDSSYSTHSHSVTIGGGIALNITQYLNHTKSIIWIRRA